MIKKNIKKIILKIRNYKNIHGKYKFVDRTIGKKYGCIILAGYKEILWDTVFPRVKRYMNEDVDICVVSSGLYSRELNRICEEYGWSYLSTKRNNLCLAQNIAIQLLPCAEYIYKLDEDMFVTKEFCNEMRKVYWDIKNSSRYNPGIIAPLIPINGYGYIRLLEKCNKLPVFENKFGKAKFTGGNNEPSNFTKNKDIPLFFWNEVTELKNIDKASEKLSKESYAYTICPFRFSIGAIFFERKIWEDMGMFNVNHTTGMALDEIQLCNYCNTNSLVIAVSENCIVGHLAYGPQMDTMIQYYLENKNQFWGNLSDIN